MAGVSARTTRADRHAARVLFTLSAWRRAWLCGVAMLLCLAVGCRDSRAGRNGVAKLPRADKGFVVRTTNVGGRPFIYQVHLPPGFTAGRAWPVIVALHGSGARGTDGAAQTRDAFGMIVREHAPSLPAIVVFPQIPLEREGVTKIDSITMQALNATIAEFRGDPQRIYLTGVSLGSATALDIAVAHPERFAALVLVSGGICGRCVLRAAGVERGDEFQVAASRLRNIPVRLIHGAEDTTIEPDIAQRIAASLRAVNKNVQLDLLPGVGHAAWTYAYDAKLFQWLFEQHISR